MNVLITTLGPAARLAAGDIDAAARYLVRLVQGSQLLEAAALDAAGRAQLLESATKLLRDSAAD